MRVNTVVKVVFNLDRIKKSQNLKRNLAYVLKSGPEGFICELCELKNASSFFKEFALFSIGGAYATSIELY